MSSRNFRTGAIIVAAGSSQRMGGVDKLLQPNMLGFQRAFGRGDQTGRTICGRA